MSKVLTGTVQGVAMDRSFELKGQVLIDGAQQEVDIAGTFEIVNSEYDNLYLGEFSADGLEAIFCISLEGHGVFITKQAEGPFAGLESGGIQAKFNMWEGNKQGWTLTFGPVVKDRAQFVLGNWAANVKGSNSQLIIREREKVRAMK